jgi:hypothetical protein
MIKLLALVLLFVAIYSVESRHKVHSKKTAQTVRTIPSITGTIRQTAKCQTLSNIQLSDTVGGISIVLTRKGVEIPLLLRNNLMKNASLQGITLTVLYDVAEKRLIIASTDDNLTCYYLLT